MNQISFKVGGQDPDLKGLQTYRRMLVGPWCNQPEEYVGYNGFVGWPGITRLSSGRWLLAFNSGYWHASYPWNPEIHEEIKKYKEFYEKFLSWRKLGMPDIYAPRGGRSHFIYSDDEGLTWSRPVTLVDTDWNDLHPAILELENGILLCTFCSADLRPNGPGLCPFRCRPEFMRSTDNGKTWTDPEIPPEGTGGFGNGSAIRCRDGSVLWAIENRITTDKGFQSPGIVIYRSVDQGKTFQRWSVAASQQDTFEPGIAELPDGRIVLITRESGDLFFSDDGAKTWTQPLSSGVKLYDPHLLMLPNGVLACFHGSYTRKGGVHVILSPDGGRTWQGPVDRAGYAVDPGVYGYCHPMLLPDGTVYLVYQNTGGHATADARTMALWGLRVRIHDDAAGLDILPAPGSPEDLGLKPVGLQAISGSGGNPEHGKWK
jgi:hypothetical protein